MAARQAVDDTTLRLLAAIFANDAAGSACCGGS